MSTNSLNLLLALTLVAAAPAVAQTVPPATKAEVNKLIGVLKTSGPRKEKADACRQLAVIGTKDAVPALAALLPNEELSHMARYGLEPIPDPSVDEALRAAIPQLRGRLLAGVITSTGVRRDAKAVPLLAPRLQDQDSDVVQAAARALGKIGNAAAAKALQSAVPNAAPANLWSVCEGALRCAEALAAKGDRKQALAIYEQLRGLSSPHQVRTAALRGAILNRKDGVQLLQENLRNSDYLLFAAAVRTAQEMKGAEVTKALCSELPRLSPDHQVVTIQTLAKRADPGAVPALRTLAQEGPKPVRLAATRALGEIGDASALPLLKQLLNDPDREIAKSAQEAFASLRGRNIDAAVLAMVTGGSVAQRVQGMELIGRRRMSSGLPVLLQAATDADPDVRATALKQVGELGTPAEAPAVLQLLLRAQTSQELDAAEQALGGLCAKAEKPEACADQVNRALAKASPAQTGALLRVLTAIGGPQALTTVRAAVKDQNGDVRNAAIRALGAWKTADAGPDLLALAKDASDPTQKTLSLRNYLALASNPELSAPQRLTMCREVLGLAQQTEDKKMLLAALGGINSPDALNLIAPFLDDPSTRDEAGAATVGIAERLLRGQNRNKLAARLIAPLEKVAQAGANSELTQRAKALLQQAKSRAANSTQ